MDDRNAFSMALTSLSEDSLTVSHPTPSQHNRSERRSFSSPAMLNSTSLHRSQHQHYRTPSSPGEALKLYKKLPPAVQAPLVQPKSQQGVACPPSPRNSFVFPAVRSSTVPTTRSAHASGATRDSVNPAGFIPLTVSPVHRTSLNDSTLPGPHYRQQQQQAGVSPLGIHSRANTLSNSQKQRQCHCTRQQDGARSSSAPLDPVMEWNGRVRDHRQAKVMAQERRASFSEPEFQSDKFAVLTPTVQSVLREVVTPGPDNGHRRGRSEMGKRIVEEASLGRGTELGTTVKRKPVSASVVNYDGNAGETKVVEVRITVQVMKRVLMVVLGLMLAWVVLDSVRRVVLIVAWPARMVWRVFMLA